MDADKFTEYIEGTLSFDWRRGTEALHEREQIAWQLHQSGAPAGSVLLGDLLIRNRYSHSHKEIEAVPFARKLLEQAFVSLVAQQTKGPWDWYYLGICHEAGRGTPVNHRSAADCFRHAREAGNIYAHYEGIWSAYLSGTPALETIFRFRYYSGPLQRFADLSAGALALLEMGPARELGSTHHISRILEISRLLHEFYFHDAGHRHINVRVGKEMKRDVDALKVMAVPTAALTLFLIAKKSPSNPTGAEAETWLRGAIHPDNHSLLPLAKRDILAEEHLKLITEVCQKNGWGDSEICRFATWALAHRDGDDEGSSEWFP